MEKSKIICTLGPASSEKEVIAEMAKAGMDYVRINLSHGTLESHQRIIDNYNEVLKNSNYKLKLIADTKGPEMRVGKFKSGKVVLKKGQAFCFTSRNILGNENEVSISYEPLVKNIRIGDKIFANNGMLVFSVKEVDETDIKCKVLFDGILTNNKGINVPHIKICNEFISQQDKIDLAFAIKNNVDYVAASFVSSKQDVLKMRKFLDENGGSKIKIISKIENESGVKNIKQIIEASDAIMVARGDLGVEIELEKIPFIQKKIIKECNKQHKPSIVATEMLESMTNSVRPTRAEVSDVANAVFDKCSATMLSGETAVGINPPAVVKMMSKILNEAERHMKTADLIEF